MNTDNIFFITFAIIIIVIIVAFVWCYLAFKDYNSSLSVETEKEKIEVTSQTTSIPKP